MDKTQYPDHLLEIMGACPDIGTAVDTAHRLGMEFYPRPGEVKGPRVYTWYRVIIPGLIALQMKVFCSSSQFHAFPGQWGASFDIVTGSYCALNHGTHDPLSNPPPLRLPSVGTVPVRQSWPGVSRAGVSAETRAADIDASVQGWLRAYREYAADFAEIMSQVPETLLVPTAPPQENP